MRIVNLGPARGADQVMVGTVVKPHGIRGEIKVLPAGRADALPQFREVTLADPASGSIRQVVIEKSGSHERLLILRLQGLADRDSAERLRGWEVRAARAVMPPLDANAAYWHELEGAPVMTAEGRHLGAARELMHNGAQEVLVAQGEYGREYLIPVVEEFISHRSADGTLVVTPPPGLLEMNAVS
ncbi:MAG: ribosome maturation factor RimM [Thermodesulfobacteriota bacterium]